MDNVPGEKDQSQYVNQKLTSGSTTYQKYMRTYQKNRYDTDPLFRRRQILKSKMRYYRMTNQDIKYEAHLLELRSISK